MFQQIILIGNCGRDPEMRYTPQGTPVTTLNVATSEKWTDNQGQTQERTYWFRVLAYGKLGEIVNQYLSKGKKVFVEGALVCDPKTGGPKVYTRKDGTAGASFEVRAANVRFLSPRTDGENNHSDPAPAGTTEGYMTEEELPF